MAKAGQAQAQGRRGVRLAEQSGLAPAFVRVRQRPRCRTARQRSGRTSVTIFLKGGTLLNVAVHVMHITCANPSPLLWISACMSMHIVY